MSLPTSAFRNFWQQKKWCDADLEELSKLRQTAAAVVTSRYQQLETYLQAQQWKAADEETYRLMITTVGKEEGQWLDREDLLNFPCEDLRTIDALWVKYSQGRFGFSVQKQIYVQCGATLDGNYPGDAIWEEFGDRVGWRNNGDWLGYSELNPSLSSPQGLFSIVWVFSWATFWRLGWWPWVVRVVGCLFSRTGTCRP